MTTEQVRVELLEALKQVQIDLLESLKRSKASNPELPWEFVIDAHLARIQETAERERRKCTQ